MSITDSGIADRLPRLRRLAHALVCEPGRADELVTELVEETARDVDRTGADFISDTQLIRRLRRLWISHREEWQAALPLDPTTDIAQAMQAMSALPRNQREAVALVVVGELDYRDAADIAGVSRVILTERLLSGRKALAALFAESPA